jgi:hypothetical protein
MGKKIKQKEGKEVIIKDLTNKTIYEYVNVDGVKMLSREVYKNRPVEIHFPFRARDGKQKYKTIKAITYEKLPKTLPAGFLKAPRTGYGFSKELAPILYEVQKQFPKVDHVVVTSIKKSEFKNGKVITFSLSDLQTARPQIGSLLERQKNEVQSVAQNVLAKLFSTHFKSQKKEIKKGELNLFLSQNKIKATALSQADIESLAQILSDLPASHSFVKTRKILATKESIDKVYFEDIIEKFEKLLSASVDSKRLEDKWQQFFSANILYFNFGYVERFEKTKIQGDKKLNIPDFILQNTYSYLDIFEMKTHLTQLLSFDTGRKNFYWTGEASKAISQAENYVDSVTKEEDRIIKNIRDEYDIHNIDAVRPNVYIIASSRNAIAGKSTVTKYQGAAKRKLWNDFRRLNSSLKNIHFMLFDELLEVFKNTLKRIA